MRITKVARGVSPLIAFTVALIFATSVFPKQKISGREAGQQVDTYQLSFVRNAFESFKGTEKYGGYNSFQLKYFTNNSPSLTQLGDSTSVAVLKLYNLEDLVKPENTRAYLIILSLSFSDRQRISEETDRNPRVTALVLDYLQRNTSDSRIKEVIDHLKKCVDTDSCPKLPES